MFTTIALIVLLLLAIGLLVGGAASKRRATKAAAAHNEANEAAFASNSGYGRKSERVEAEPFGKSFGYLPAWVAAVPLALFLVFGFFACTAVVDAKTEGVLLTFKKPSERLLDSGLAVKAPWQSVVEIDGTRKTDNFNNGKANEDDDPTQDHSVIKCRLGDNGVAEVYASINWFRAEGTSNRVYEQYRSEDPVESMRENLVIPRFKDAINQTCSDYRPTANIDALSVNFSDPQEVSEALKNLDLAPDFAALSEAATDNMNALLEPSDGSEQLVFVEKVSISYLSLPKSTETKIAQFLDEATKTRTALQSQATAAATAEANKILADSVSNDPFVLVARCFDLVADGLLVLPAGGSCWPGGGSAVVIPGASKP